VKRLIDRRTPLEKKEPPWLRKKAVSKEQQDYRNEVTNVLNDQKSILK